MSASPRSVIPTLALCGAAVSVAMLVLASPAHAATATVEVRDFAYTPAELEIVVGDTVRWNWLGESRHSVTAPGVFDSHPGCTALTQEECGTAGASFSWTSTEPGTIEYGCKVHPDQMRGTLTVVAQSEPEPGPTTAPAPADPSPSPTAAPPPSPSPASRPSPSPTTASPKPTATSPSPSPSPRPTRRSAPSLGFGEATRIQPSPLPEDGGGADVAAPLVSDVSPEPLEPFPAAPSPAVSPDPLADDVVAVGPTGGSGRNVVRLAGAAAVVLSLLTFGRVVLFGSSWE